MTVARGVGITTEQRERIEDLLENHIERVVDHDVRLKTEELPAEERARLGRELQVASRQGWDRLRNEILNEEQRKRVPKRRR